MSELDRRARAMLHALRVESTPAADRADAELVRIEARIVALDEEGDDERDAPIAAAAALAPVSASFVAQSAAISIAIAAGVLLALRLVAVGVHTLLPAPERAMEQAADVPVAHATATAEVRTPDKPAPRDVAIVPAPPPADAPAADAVEPVEPPPVPRRSTPARSSSDLAAEVALVRAAAAEPDANAALTLLTEHARTFPEGTLAREREVLRAERLCALGRTAEARTVADRFLADRRDDPLAQRMSRACAKD